MRAARASMSPGANNASSETISGMTPTFEERIGLPQAMISSAALAMVSEPFDAITPASSADRHAAMSSRLPVMKAASRSPSSSIQPCVSSRVWLASNPRIKSRTGSPWRARRPAARRKSRWPLTGSRRPRSPKVKALSGILNSRRTRSRPEGSKANFFSSTPPRMVCTRDAGTSIESVKCAAMREFVAIRTSAALA